MLSFLCAFLGVAEKAYTRHQERHEPITEEQLESVSVVNKRGL